MRELLSKVKRIGIESGVIEIRFYSDDTDHNIGFDFYDEDTGVDCSLESISLVEFSSVKESNVVGEFDLKRIKNSEESKKVEKLLLKKVKDMEFQLVSRAKELAKEISEKSGLRVKVDRKIKGDPQVLTEFDINMSIAREYLSGIEDDY
jgi:PIN domain nuclease of toxin-antitoxin system